MWRFIGSLGFFWVGAGYAWDAVTYFQGDWPAGLRIFNLVLWTTGVLFAGFSALSLYRGKQGTLPWRPWSTLAITATSLVLILFGAAWSYIALNVDDVLPARSSAAFGWLAQGFVALAIQVFVIALLGLYGGTRAGSFEF